MIPEAGSEVIDAEFVPEVFVIDPILTPAQADRISSAICKAIDLALTSHDYGKELWCEHIRRKVEEELKGNV